LFIEEAVLARPCSNITHSFANNGNGKRNIIKKIKTFMSLSVYRFKMGDAEVEMLIY
jgi:hypothetical protein